MEKIIDAIELTLDEYTNYPDYRVKHTSSNSHAHYFKGIQAFDINEEVKVVIDNLELEGKWEVFSRYEGIELWIPTNLFIDSQTLTFTE